MKKFISSALLIVAAIHPTEAEVQRWETTGEASPKLIIGITVDQLRTDYLQALQSKFSEGGFKRLLKEGLVYEHVVFDLVDQDAVANMAVLAVGSYPFVNGIPSGDVYNPATLREQSVFHDSKFLGNYTNDNFSPKALLSSTLGDELKLASDNNARVYAIAPSAEAAIIGGGHKGNAAFWIDDKTGKWATSTYYKDLPTYADRFNRSDAPSYNIGLKHWTPLEKGAKNVLLPYKVSDTNASFDHQFLQFGKPYYPWFKSSALVNEAVTKFCKVFLENGGIGQGRSTDMLQLTYYAGAYQNSHGDLFPDELQDTYLRLDKTLEELLKTIDATVGLNHTLVYLVSTGQTNLNNAYVLDTPAGEFSPSRCTALLNSYLISLYGQGSWVAGFGNNQIYLQHKEIEAHKLTATEVQKTASEFVAMFSGVQDVVTASQILHEDYNTRIARLRNSYHKGACGDLIVTLQPGWAIKADDNLPPTMQLRHDIAPGPAIIFAPHRVEAQKISTPVEAVNIAPTIARIIRIRAPSSCSATPLF